MWTKHHYFQFKLIRVGFESKHDGGQLGVVRSVACCDTDLKPLLRLDQNQVVPQKKHTHTQIISSFYQHMHENMYKSDHKWDDNLISEEESLFWQYLVYIWTYNTHWNWPSAFEQEHVGSHHMLQGWEHWAATLGAREASGGLGALIWSTSASNSPLVGEH